METLGEYLRQKRMVRRLSLRDMAGHVESDAGNLSRIERDEMEPSRKLLEAYARFLKLPQNESDLMFSLAGRLPPDISPIEIQRQGLYRFVRDNLLSAETKSGAHVAIGTTVGKG